MPTFEELLDLVQRAPLPVLDDERQVQWCEQSEVLGVSRQKGGAFELFLRGDQLLPVSPLVRRHMRFDEWSRAGGELFRANRLVFPADDHYAAVAAFLAEEFLRRGIAESLASGFAKTEPLVEMALRRLGLSEDELLGLLGELRFLEVLLTVGGQGRKAIVLDGWRGHQRGSRDFIFGRGTVEVKSTRGSRSIHAISNVMQVDPRRSDAGEPQETLFLLSMGFSPVESNEGAALSLPRVVDQILSQLAADAGAGEVEELHALFLTKVVQYGSEPGNGYDHSEMRGWSSYQSTWQHGFVRIYDMSDPTISVLRRADIRRHRHVLEESVCFEICLPEQVSGDVNPRSDLFALARGLL